MVAPMLLPSIVSVLLATSSSPASKIIDNVRGVYRDLEADSVGSYYTPTIKFSHVSPSLPSVGTEDINAMHKESNDIIHPHSLTTDRKKMFDEVATSHNNTKPLALYLPGLDCTGISAHMQFPALAETFEFWKMSVDTSDRTSFTDLSGVVTEFMKDVSQNGRKVVLIGESFGGLLAPSVALRSKDVLKGMVLVNPATSFDSTQWSTFAPLLTSLRYFENIEEDGKKKDENSLPSIYSVLGGVALAATIPDGNQFQRIVDNIIKTPVSNSEELSELLSTMSDGFGILADKLPADTLEFRIQQWLPVGTAVVNPRLKNIDVPTLIIGGLEDNMLPTKEEANRLVEILPNAKKVEFDSSGHFVLDERVDLRQVILDSDIFPADKRYDPILDWKPPSTQVIEETLEGRVKPLRRLVGPVFFSTDSDGKRHKGLGRVPKKGDGPLLFVANHQFGGLDLGLIIAQLIEDRDLYVRGLAHPVIFGGANAGNPENTNTNIGGGGMQDSTFQTFGAVQVSPRSYYKLMSTNQAAMLFPGGVREVFHGKDEAYQLFWPEDKTDFVRTAAKFNATIIPLSAIGAADSVNILIDSPDILKLPFGLGERAANSSKQVMAARYDGDNDSEIFTPPFALPKLLPARHYFVFGKPISTADVGHNDKEGCSKVYKDIKTEMERGLSDLLDAREKDPFADTARRIAYEQVTGKSAPTFGLDELR